MSHFRACRGLAEPPYTGSVSRENGRWTRESVRACFSEWERQAQDEPLPEEARFYISYHAPRYARLLNTVDALMAESGAQAPLRVLDVGPNFEMELLRRAYPDAILDSLGFAHPYFVPPAGGRHVEFDLNDAADAERWPDLGQHDVAVVSEVVEHLHTAMHIVLRLLATYVRPGGAIVIQTPNACALHKRLRMLAGRNPYEPIRENPKNPGHFHEYTLGELRTEAERADLSLAGYFMANYFEPPGAGARLYERVGPLLPESLRHGITVWLRRGGPAVP
jgi:SAM-dependent methyltransferase